MRKKEKSGEKEKIGGHGWGGDDVPWDELFQAWPWSSFNQL